jgi:hypothetical protein
MRVYNGFETVTTIEERWWPGVSLLCPKELLHVSGELPMTMLAVVSLMLQIDARAPEMYSVILDDTRTFKDAVIVIESVSLEIPTIWRTTNTSCLGQFHGWPAELMAVLEGNDRAPTVGPFAQEEVPTGARLIPRSEIHAVFSPDPLSGWSRLEQAIGARTWQAFSRPVLSADGLQALIYAEHHCGTVCGHGKYFWLSRSDTSDKWRISRQVLKWIS